MRRFSIRLVVFLLLAAAVLAVGGCGKAGTGTNSGKDRGIEKNKTETINVAVYYPKINDNGSYLVREVHAVPLTKDVKVAALNELIKGKPKTGGAFRVLPEGTKVLGVTVKNGIATVDFSRDVLNANVGASGEALGIQSIVNTLTEFSGIEKVSFTVEGGLDQRTQDWWGHIGLYNQPFGRDMSVVWEPVIWVTEPEPGEKISSPVTVKGSARVFEATVSLRLITSKGEKLVESFTTATEGAPGRGDFKAVLEYPRPDDERGYLEVFWKSPKDGSELDKVRVPVKFE